MSHGAPPHTQREALWATVSLSSWPAGGRVRAPTSVHVPLPMAMPWCARVPVPQWCDVTHCHWRQPNEFRSAQKSGSRSPPCHLATRPPPRLRKLSSCVGSICLKFTFSRDAVRLAAEEPCDPAVATLGFQSNTELPPARGPLVAARWQPWWSSGAIPCRLTRKGARAAVAQVSISSNSRRLRSRCAPPPMLVWRSLRLPGCIRSV